MWVGAETRVLRRMFGPKREEVVGGWTELHNTRVSYFVLSTNYLDDQIKEDEMGGHTKFW
jgi:hypothetical protein